MLPSHKGKNSCPTNKYIDDEPKRLLVRQKWESNKRDFTGYLGLARLASVSDEIQEVFPSICVSQQMELALFRTPYPCKHCSQVPGASCMLATTPTRPPLLWIGTRVSFCDRTSCNDIHQMIML